MKAVRKILVGIVVFGAVVAASAIVPDFEIREKSAAACDPETGVNC